MTLPQQWVATLVQVRVGMRCLCVPSAVRQPCVAVQDGPLRGIGVAMHSQNTCRNCSPLRAYAIVPAGSKTWAKDAGEKANDQAGREMTSKTPEPASPRARSLGCADGGAQGR